MVFRYSACLTLHVVCSFILGFGVNQKPLASVKEEIHLLKGNKNIFFIPTIIYNLFNMAVVIFENSLGL